MVAHIFAFLTVRAAFLHHSDRVCHEASRKYGLFFRLSKQVWMIAGACCNRLNACGLSSHLAVKPEAVEMSSSTARSVLSL